MADDLPDTADKAIRAFIALFILGAVLEGWAAWHHDETIRAIEYWAVGAMLSALGVFWVRFRTWAGPHFTATATQVATDFRWWVISLIFVLAVISISPYVEQRRWPYADWLKLAPIVTNPQLAPTADVAKLTAERDKAFRDRDTAFKDLDDVKRQLATAKAAAAAMAPGTMNTSAGEVGALLLLQRPFSKAEIIAKTPNIKAADVEAIPDPSNAAIVVCGTSCTTIRIVFDGGYGPFDVSIRETTSQAIAPTLPKVTITRAGESFLDVVIDPGVEISVFGSGLRELHLSIIKRTY